MPLYFCSIVFKVVEQSLYTQASRCIRSQNCIGLRSKICRDLLAIIHTTLQILFRVLWYRAGAHTMLHDLQCICQLFQGENYIQS